MDAPNDPVIQLPSIKALWRVRATNDIMNPQAQTAMLVRKAVTITEAIKLAQTLPGFTDFKKQFPKAEIVSAEFGGFLEN